MGTIQKLFILFMMIFFLGSMAQAQDLIDYERISSKKVKKRLQRQTLNGLKLIKDIQKSCCEQANLDEYYYVESKYFRPESVDELWEIYTNFNPTLTWKGPMNKFQLLYDKKTEEYFYVDSENFPKPAVGQMIFLDLKIAKILHVPVGFEYTKIDEENKILEFTYLKGGQTLGRQTIKFEQTLDTGETMIRHWTYYTGAKKFRQEVLYPPFHEQTIGEFHQNIWNQVE